MLRNRFDYFVEFNHYSFKGHCLASPFFCSFDCSHWNSKWSSTYFNCRHLQSLISAKRTFTWRIWLFGQFSFGIQWRAISLQAFNLFSWWGWKHSTGMTLFFGVSEKVLFAYYDAPWKSKFSQISGCFQQCFPFKYYNSQIVG